MSDYGIKMSKPGVDVKTASDKDLSWSSDFKTFKIYKIVKFTSTGNKTHGLNYPPAFVAFAPNDFFYDLSLASVDDTKVYLEHYPGSAVYVILYIDPLDE